jgi:hypothetical protein
MFTPMEGSHRVPFILRWSGRIPADRDSDAMCMKSAPSPRSYASSAWTCPTIGRSMEGTNEDSSLARVNPQRAKGSRSTSGT